MHPNFVHFVARYLTLNIALSTKSAIMAKVAVDEVPYSIGSLCSTISDLYLLTRVSYMLVIGSESDVYFIKYLNVLMRTYPGKRGFVHIMGVLI